jgi:Ca-activated chloride channel homolog
MARAMTLQGIGTVVMTVAVSAPLAAQTFKSRVESVRLDALVLDRGQPVHGLTAEDFEIRDNGALQRVTLLGAGALPLDVVLVLDMSGSLSAHRLEALRAAGGALLDALGPADRAALVTFSREIHRAQPLTHDVGAVRRALEREAPSGPTVLVDAMFAAIGTTEPGDRRSLLIVFSDGLDTASWLQPDAVIRAAERSDVVIYAVSTASARHAPGLLRQVTDSTGGQLLEVDSASLSTAFTRVLNEFRQRYVLSYTLPSTPSDGWHRLDVRVKNRDLTVRARSGYRVVRPRPTAR